MVGLAWDRPDIPSCDVTGRAVSHTGMVHQRAGAPSGTDRVAGAAAGAGHRGYAMSHRTRWRAGNWGRLTSRVMTTGSSAVGGCSHTGVAIDRQPGSSRVANRTLLRGQNVIGLGRCKTIAGVGVTRFATGQAGMVNQCPRAPAGANCMASAATGAGHRGHGVRQGAGRGASYWNSLTSSVMATGCRTVG